MKTRNGSLQLISNILYGSSDMPRESSGRVKGENRIRRNPGGEELELGNSALKRYISSGLLVKSCWLTCGSARVELKSRHKKLQNEMNKWKSDKQEKHTWRRRHRMKVQSRHELELKQRDIALKTRYWEWDEAASDLGAGKWVLSVGSSGRNSFFLRCSLLRPCSILLDGSMGLAGHYWFDSAISSWVLLLIS